ncbi:alpha/beta hydrolase family protein [Bdellovibrio sp. HCB337]|uniref:alpha/beta hydrolase family protein n=1 Tax=Bdellovibrio sp. HCB337 TaxID=3394358 RepID=UPI0039A5AF31
MKQVLIITGLILSSLQAEAFRGVEFSIPSKDLKTHITGQIDYPTADCGPEKLPSVLIVSGTGFIYRDGFAGKSGTERDYIYRDLSKRFTQNCVITVRYDYRGVLCDIKAKEDGAKCIDQKIRAEVTSENIQEDIESVYLYALTQPQVDAGRFGILGHSEGTYNVAKLVSEKRVQPKTLLFMGAMLESPVTMIRWQMADRIFEYMFELDANKDEVLTNEEIQAGFLTSNLIIFGKPDQFLHPEGSWKKEEERTLLRSQYTQYRKAVLLEDDKAPYITNSFVFASYKYWKMWFSETTPVLRLLADFQGPILIHNGDRDSQTPGLREQAYLQKYNWKIKSHVRFNLHPGKGHGLGNHPLIGPIDEAIADQMVQDLKTALE